MTAVPPASAMPPASAAPPNQAGPIAVAPVPGWDPGPRRPGWTAALVALLLVVAGTGFGLYRLIGLIGTPHPVRPDICPALDLGPLTETLGPVGLLDPPGTPERRGGYSRAICGFTVDGEDFVPGVIGSLLVDWYDYEFPAELIYARAEGEQAKSLSTAPFLTQLPGLGEQAFAGFDPDEHAEAGKRLRLYSVTARDANVVLNLNVMVPDAADDAPWRNGQVDDAYPVLTRIARTALQRLL
ncbi:hypothetical protein AB0368_35725 [Actinoplanes sp. NPDC051475]|uniref:hypothetical protein n=1 Tax=Actinoplanes sp. NPDC051475 TaxID=3157225 RepID=UPI00344D4D4A